MLDRSASASWLTRNAETGHTETGHRVDDLQLALPSMVDARVRNAQAPWADFSSEEYYAHNYKSVQAEDQEIIERVSLFFIDAFAERDRAECAIDVGSGSNLYPALLMLPWADHIQLTDYSPRNVSWLAEEIREDRSPWAWQPFWRQLQGYSGYDRISEPRQQLKAACLGDHDRAGVKRQSVFELPRASWQLGTMFFVAESITEEFTEFREAIGRFVGALQAGAPFAAAFMAGSLGYEVDGTWFPALKVTGDDVRECFEKFGANSLNVYMNETSPGVRPGYEGMIVATGITGSR